MMSKTHDDEGFRCPQCNSKNPFMVFVDMQSRDLLGCSECIDMLWLSEYYEEQRMKWLEMDE